MKKSLKKLLASLMTVVMLFGLVPMMNFSITASAAEVYSGTCGENLTWTLDTETGELVISGEGEMDEATFLDYRSYIKSAILGNGVTSICNQAFYRCVNLTSIEIPESVTNIGNDVFWECSGLISIEIPEGVTSISDYLFSDCTNLANVVIPESVTSIGVCAFAQCVNLTDIDIPDSVTTIGGSAFTGCSGLISIEIPDSVTSIGGYVFRDCSNLRSIKLPINIEQIGYGALTDIETVYYPGDLTQWNEILKDEWSYNEYSVILECDSERPYYIPGECGDNLTWILYVDGELIISGEGDMTSSPWEGLNDKITSVTMSDGVTSIWHEAFVGCENLTTLPIGKGVKKIGDRAFGNCHGLTDIVIPEGVENIGTLAFITCNNLKSAHIPASVTEIGISPFGGSYNLEEITVAEDNQNYCSYEGVLFNKDKTELIQYPGGSGTEYTIPDSVETVNVYSFVYCCYYFEKVIIPDSVKVIDSYAFTGCISLKEVTIGNGIEVINEGAFYETSISDVYYYGTEEEWNEIEILDGNECLLNATIHFLGDEHELTHITVPSTCKVPGMEYDLCIECGETFNSSVLPLADHTWSEWTVVTEATTKAEGLKTRKCGVCGEAEEEIIPMLKELVDEETGIIIEYGDEYEPGVEIVVEESFDGDAYQLINTAYGNNNQSVIFDISTVKDGVKVQPEDKVKVRIPLPEGFGTKGIFVCYIDSVSGKVTSIPAKVVDGYVEFVAEHFSYYAVVEKLGKVNSVSIDDISMSYKDGANLAPSINIDSGVKYTVTYSSSNTDVVSVDSNGNLTTNGTGSATITVTVTDEYGNTVTDTCNVNVSYTWWQWIIVIVLFGWIWY